MDWTTPNPTTAWTRVGALGSAAVKRALAPFAPGRRLAVGLGLLAACGSSGADATHATSSSSTAADTSAAATSTTSAPGTSTTSAASTSDPSATECSFLCTPDGGAAGSFACDAWAQECPDGEKCSPYAEGGGGWDATKCVPIDPNPVDVGEPCMALNHGFSGLDDCVEGAMCLRIDPETDLGACIGLCQGEWPECVEDTSKCCPQGFTCAVTIGFGLCFPDCSPLHQDCEEPDRICYPYNDVFGCVPDDSGDAGAAGDPCEYFNSCDAGHFCGNPVLFPGCDPDAAGCCVPFCDLDAPTCPPGSHCTPWYLVDPPPHYADLGACVIP